MLDDKQLELLIDAADHEWIAAKYRVEMGVDRAMHGDECEEKALKLIRAARAVVDAKRTPITAEALLAEGWRKTYQTEEYGGILEISAPEEFDNTCLWAHCVEFALDGTLKRVVDSRNRTIGGVRTMYDIGELVRLLGGA